ncbi:ring-cleaving dioxygenase [Natronorarus salvus]|uniref:ring-cleaving dioxygenase n=1 Tax=Natronorarus salvus TaxID=3117733 RepID=UPI002F26354F
MPTPIPGIHHVTAIASDPAANVTFYTETLGLRLVKRTVNFDAPDTYHLYYADGAGTPGTAMTFFPWPNASPGRPGTGQVTTTQFSIPDGSAEFWADRLEREGVDVERTVRFGESVLVLSDPDGIGLELVGSDGGESEPWGEEVPEEHAIRGFHGVSLTVGGYERSAELLETMGYEAAEEDAPRFRYRTEGLAPVVDLVCRPDAMRGSFGPGTVHHVAFRMADDVMQAEWREALAESGFDPTPVLDRQYFRSIYFREPNGVLYEFATDPPGFTADESVDDLGGELKLPPWLEGDREEIEASLPPLPLEGGR